MKYINYNVGEILKKDQSDSQTKAEIYFDKWNTQAKCLRDLACPVFESHAHYNLQSFNGVRDELMELMHKSGVDRIIIPAVKYSTNKQMMEMFDNPDYPYVYFAFGNHPKYLWKEVWNDSKREEYESLLLHRKCVAVGEVGLDYSYAGFCEEHRVKQMELFTQFIKMANKVKLPMILHIRPDVNSDEYVYDVKEDAWKIMSEYRIENGAVLHCFEGSYSDVTRYMSVGVTAFGIGGKITYDNSDLEEAVRKIPEKAILLETDAPYIKTDNSRMPNTSFSLLDIAHKVAELKNTSVEHILKVTNDNSMKLFSRIK